jgi:hypothetical protein
MKLLRFHPGTRKGWKTVASIAILVSGAIFLIEYQAHRKHRATEVLAKGLITKFHEEFNSVSEPSTGSDSDWSTGMIQEVRSRTGKFKQLGPCKVERVSEPPYLSTECRSTFEAGVEIEIFLFSDNGKDYPLLQYSAVPIVEPAR